MMEQNKTNKKIQRQKVKKKLTWLGFSEILIENEIFLLVPLGKPKMK